MKSEKEGTGKERTKGARERVGKSKDVGFISHIVEGDDSCFIVQENPHTAWGLFQAEGGLWGCESFILVPMTPSQKPVSIGRRGSDLPLPAH